MKSWIKVFIVVAVPSFLVIFFLLLFVFWFRRQRQKSRQLPSTVFDELAAKVRQDTAQKEILDALKFQFTSKPSNYSHRLHHHSRSRHTNGQLRQGNSVDWNVPQPFKWEDNPELIAEAAENGWMWFAFSVMYSTVSRTPSPFFSRIFLADDEDVILKVPEITWDIQPGSSELTQTVRINPKVTNSNYCSIRMRLPLPGPSLPGTPFPQEAYFEITLLSIQPLHQKHQRSSKRAKESSESDRTKLIEGNSSNVNSPVNNLKFTEENDRVNQNVVIFLGLTANTYSASPSPPGTYPFSVGFSSSGDVFIDGMELELGKVKTEWAAVDRVIGCGIDPNKKEVFFTVDSELVKTIDCESDVYRNPLFPVIASGTDVSVSVNLGQSAFKYSPANANRTPNPSFLPPQPADSAAGLSHEDSRELFSMGRIDSKWKNATRFKSGGRKSNANFDGEDGEVIDAESDLFEIALE